MNKKEDFLKKIIIKNADFDGYNFDFNPYQDFNTMCYAIFETFKKEGDIKHKVLNHHKTLKQSFILWIKGRPSILDLLENVFCTEMILTDIYNIIIKEWWLYCGKTLWQDVD